MGRRKDIMKCIEDMYNSHADNLYYFLLAKLKSKQDAEEVLQNVFLKISDMKETVLGINEPKAYLFAVARNEAVNFAVSGKNRRNEIGIDELLFEPADKTVNKEEALALEKAVLSLPEDQSAVIILKLYRGMTFEEIAVAMSIPSNTAASKYRYALDNLKKTIRE